MAIKKTVRKESAAIAVHASAGEKLRYSVTVVTGPIPSFVLVDSKNQKVLMSSKNLSAGAKTCSYTWPQPADPVSVESIHVMTFNFLDTITYTYTVEHVSAAGVSTVILDIDYASIGHEPAFSQALDVLTF